MAETFECARALILVMVAALSTKSLPHLDVAGRVIAEEIRAPSILGGVIHSPRCLIQGV